MRVAIIGAGYVGLTTGVALVHLGHEVAAVDLDQKRLELLRAGRSPIREPGLEGLLEQSGDRLVFSLPHPDAFRDAAVILIAVGTPPGPNGEADTSHVEAAARSAAEAFAPGRTYCVVVKSTVPIGTNRRVAALVGRALEARGVTAEVSFAANPEFLREGKALADTFYPDRIVVGADEPGAVEMLRQLYRPILEQTFEPPAGLGRPSDFALPPLIATDPVSAEMIKYAANAFLALKISYINEIAGLCERVGADVSEVARGIGLDGRIGPRFLSAGLGWGGSCLPKDTSALTAVAAEFGYPLQIVTAAREVNARQRLVIVEKLQGVLKGLRGRTIGVLGLAFKPGTDDLREAPALEVVRVLIERGAHVRAHDPVALSAAAPILAELGADAAADPFELAAGADGLVLATDWEEYLRLDLKALARLMNTAVLVDGRNLFDPRVARAAGFTYLGVGR